MGSIRDRIAKQSGPRTETVTIPEWDVTVEIRSITLKQHSAVLRESMDGDEVDMGEMVPRLLVLSVYDPDTNEPAFTADDVEMLAAQAAGVIERLGMTAMRVSGMDPQALESGKGNSSTIPTSGTGSSSRNASAARSTSSKRR